jgi:hypothetical protein
MPLLLTALPYVICGSILWLIVLQCAPIGSTISLVEIISVLFLLGITQVVWVNNFSPTSWMVDLAMHFVVLAILLVGITRLAFLKAIKASAIYCALFVVISTVITMVAK